MSVTDDRAQGFIDGTVDVSRYHPNTVDARETPSMVVSLIREGTRVLDVGCGAGIITARIRDERRCQVLGLEPHETRANEARSRGIEVLTDILDPSTAHKLGKFDSVIFCDVLEHLVDPLEVLETAISVLAPGGTIIASVPNIAHWSVRMDLLFGRFNYTSTGIMDATHLRWFTRRTIRELFERANMNVDYQGVTAGLWMPEYAYRRPWKWIRRSWMERMVNKGIQYWPGLFGCQHIIRASPK